MIYADPFAQPGIGGTPVDYQQGQMDQCCRIICWILVSLFVLGLIIWLVRWITRPAYPIYVVPRHNLVDVMHQVKSMRGFMSE